MHTMDEEKTNSMQNASGDFIAEGTSTIYTYSVSEAGLFYIGRNQTRLMYYDYEADTSYVLCSTSGCRHSDDSCPAYVGNCYRVFGFACYNGKLYLLKCEEYGEDLKLIEMDVDGQNQRTVASFEWGDSSVGTWQINSVMPVYYCSNHAIMQIDYSMNSEDEDGNLTDSSASQLVMVDLSCGTVTELTDKTISSEQYSMGIDSVSSSYCIYSLEAYDEPFLDEGDFYEKYGDTESYSEYYESGYYEQTHGTITYWLLDLETEEVSLLRTEDIAYDSKESEDDEIYGVYYMTMFDAIADDWVLVFTDGVEAEDETVYSCTGSIYSLLNLKTGEEKYVFPTAEETSCGFATEGSVYGESLYNEEDILLYYKEDEEFRLYRYSMLDQTMEEIVGAEDYFLWGITESKVIGSYLDSLHISWLSKEDYEAGNMDARVSIALDW